MNYFIHWHSPKCEISVGFLWKHFLYTWKIYGRNNLHVSWSKTISFPFFESIIIFPPYNFWSYFVVLATSCFDRRSPFYNIHTIVSCNGNKIIIIFHFPILSSSNYELMQITRGAKASCSTKTYSQCSLTYQVDDLVLMYHWIKR